MTRPAPTVTVPVEPTEAMIEAWDVADCAIAESDRDKCRAVWSAMLAAAPAAPQAAGVGEKSLGQRAYERMRDHNDNAIKSMNSTVQWSELSEDERKRWDEDASERPFLYGLRAPSRDPEGEAVAWACKTCNSPRTVDPCQKCGTALTKPAEGWEWPGLPDIDRIRELAREVGYAIGVHGTLERDLDLIAAPWAAEAVGPAELAAHIAFGLGGNVVDDKVQDKPCGRWSCNIHTPDWTKLIDLSVMPPSLATREEAPAEAGEAWSRDDVETLIADAIDDSIDMDWTGRVGAKAVLRALGKDGLMIRCKNKGGEVDAWSAGCLVPGCTSEMGESCKGDPSALRAQPPAREATTPSPLGGASVGPDEAGEASSVDATPQVAQRDTLGTQPHSGEDQ